MPVYEYLCSSCGKTYEFTQRFSDKPIKACPECKGSLKKLISNTSFILKGSGWYKTDYPPTGRTDAIKTEKAETAPEKPPALSDNGSKASSKKEAADTAVPSSSDKNKA